MAGMQIKRVTAETSRRVGSRRADRTGGDAAARSDRSMGQMRVAVERMVQDARLRQDRLRLIETLIALVELCGNQEDWEGARKYAEELVALNAADAQTWATLADARRNQGENAEAAKAYVQATALAPDQAVLRRNYADTLLRLGRFGEATLQLDVAERLEPGSAFLALHRAELAKARRDLPETRRWAEEAQRLRPGWDEARALLEWVERT